jgi:HlyD family secretion protein
LRVKGALRAHPALILACVLALAGAAFWVWRVSVGPEISAYTVMRRGIVETVVASGRVVTPFRADIGSQVTGTVTAVPVAEGQNVKAGQTLVALDDTEAKAAVLQAQVAVTQAEARIRQLQELQLPVADQALRQAEANLSNARSQLERNKRLYESGFLGKAALDDAQRNLEVAETQADSARKQVETARPSGSDYAVALTALEQARASLQAARARLGYMLIRAPWDGTLIARNVERGDVVQPGKTLMVLSPTGETQLVLEIDERNLAKLKLGQRALASADAYASQKFPAEVVYINPGVDAQRGTVEVKLRVPNPPDYLRQDMTVSVDVEIARHADALVIPTDALHDALGPAPWVLRATEGKTRRQAVRVGLRGDRISEIMEGLQQGDLVLAGNSAVRDGQRVRPLVHE